jgi:hypothetical protein
LAAVCVAFAWVGKKQAARRSPGPSRSGKATPLHYRSRLVSDLPPRGSQFWRRRRRWRGVPGEAERGSGEDERRRRGSQGTVGTRAGVREEARAGAQGDREPSRRGDLHGRCRSATWTPTRRLAASSPKVPISCYSPFPHRFVCRLGRYCRVFACLTDWIG